MSCEERTKTAAELLVGKTIVGVAVLPPPQKVYHDGTIRGYSDENRLLLNFSDGTNAEIVASHGGYDSGAFDGEYSDFIDVVSIES